MCVCVCSLCFVTHHRKALQSKGIDFLTEVELGNAPPIALIVANLPEEEETQVVHTHMSQHLFCLRLCFGRFRASHPPTPLYLVVSAVMTM